MSSRRFNKFERRRYDAPMDRTTEGPTTEDPTTEDLTTSDPTSLSEAKRRVVDLLKRRGPATATVLAKVLGLTRMAVHQHLQTLEEQGWVVARSASPKGRGRPAMIWQLSEKGERRLFPDAHAELSTDLIAAARQAFGEDGLQRLIAVRSEQQVTAYRQHLALAEDLEQRVRRLAEQRSREGYMAEAVKDEDGSWLLIEHHCPICEAAKLCVGICAAELSVFRRVLGDHVVVERTRHLLTDDDRCAYRIRSAAESP